MATLAICLTASGFSFTPSSDVLIRNDSIELFGSVASLVEQALFAAIAVNRVAEIEPIGRCRVGHVLQLVGGGRKAGREKDFDRGCNIGEGGVPALELELKAKSVDTMYGIIVNVRVEVGAIGGASTVVPGDQLKPWLAQRVSV